MLLLLYVGGSEQSGFLWIIKFYCYKTPPAPSTSPHPPPSSYPDLTSSVRKCITIINLNTIVLLRPVASAPWPHHRHSAGAGVCVYKTLCPPEAVWRHPDCCPAIYAIFIPPPAANCSISTPLSTIQMWPRVIHTSHPAWRSDMDTELEIDSLYLNVSCFANKSRVGRIRKSIGTLV